MSEVKSFILKKTCAGDVFTSVSPMSNPTVTREIHLTNHNPQIVLPADWALGFIMDQGNYSLYKKKYVTFNDNDELVKLAVESGVWFETVDFMPAKEDQSQKILEVLKSGNRAGIMSLIDTYGKDIVAEVATHNVDELTTAVVSMLENLLKTQLVID